MPLPSRSLTVVRQSIPAERSELRAVPDRRNRWPHAAVVAGQPGCPSANRTRRSSGRCLCRPGRHLLLTVFLFVIAVASPAVGSAQGVRSPEVHEDGRVTFRLRAPQAESVVVEINGERLEMTARDAGGGVREVTSEPLPAGIHDYAFQVDGTRMIDPSNRLVKKWFTLASMVEIPGTPPRLTEFTAVPHGAVQRLIYDSASVGHQRPVMVYTPPGCDAASTERWPLLILMHGFGDDETAWTEVGRAHLIVDNLIAQGRIDPLVIAMPYGHPLPVPHGGRGDYFEDNNALYARDITEDLLPFLEQSFPVHAQAEHRSLAGLSMGGGHALHIGLSHPDLFSAIGAFSAATPAGTTEELQGRYPALRGPDPPANHLRDFFIPIGDRDFLLDRNQAFVEQLNSAGIRHTWQTTSGGHEWSVWRRYLPEFLERIHGREAGDSETK